MTTTTELIQSYVLEAGIANMIVHDANVLDAEIKHVKKLLKSMKRLRRKRIHYSRLKRLEERHYRLLDKYYFNDSQEIIRIVENEKSEEETKAYIKNFVSNFRGLNRYGKKFTIYIENMTKCPRFLGIHSAVKSDLLEQCKEFLSSQCPSHGNKIKMINYFVLIANY